MTEDKANLEGDRSPAQIAHDVAELLDRVAVRGPSFADQMADLKALRGEWSAVGGNDAGVALFPRTEGALGMVRASTAGDPMQATAYASLIRAKQQWRALARGE